MGNFSNSLKREVGKNTGKWVSNQLFGNGHATPIRVTVADKNNELRRKEKEAINKKRDIEKNKLEREKMRLQEKKLELKHKELRQIANAKKQKQIEKEEQEQMKQEIIASNEEEVSADLEYLQAIQAIHKVEPFKFDLDEFIITESQYEYVANNWSSFYHQEDGYLNYIDSLMILSCMAASADTRKSIPGKKYSVEEAEVLLNIGQVLGLSNEEAPEFWGYLDLNEDNEFFETCCKTLNNGPLFLRYQAISFVDWMSSATAESSSSSESDIESKYLRKVMAALKVEVNEYALIFGFKKFNIISKFALYNYKYLFENEGPCFEFDLKPVFQLMEGNYNTSSNSLNKKIDQDRKTIIELENKPSNKDWISEAADICLKEMHINTDLELISEEVKAEIEDKTPKFISKFLKKEYLDLLKSQIDKKAKKIQEERIAEKHKLLNSEPFLTYSKLTRQINEIEKEIEKKEGWIKSYENTLKLSISLLERELDEFNIKNRRLWQDFKTTMISDYELSSLISKVKKGDKSSFKNLVQTIDLLSFLEEFGCEYRIEMRADNFLIDIILNTSEVVPATKKEIRENGLKLIEKALASSEFNLISQDFLCSVVLRSASELFANVPNLNQFDIHVYDNLLNTAKGITEEVKLVEVNIDKINFSKLRLSNVDPSDALELFKPKMKFSRSTGFKALE
jgi:hypothetical protein